MSDQHDRAASTVTLDPLIRVRDGLLGGFIVTSVMALIGTAIEMPEDWHELLLALWVLVGVCWAGTALTVTVRRDSATGFGELDQHVTEIPTHAARAVANRYEIEHLGVDFDEFDAERKRGRDGKP